MTSNILQDITPLEKRLNYTFKDQSLLIQAMTHRSYLNEHADFNSAHNERLEFLGDAVLEIIVTEHLYTHYNNPEGELTAWRSALVNAKTLADIGDELGFEEFLLLSKGEARDEKSKARMYILANAMEALIGAIYLDGRTKAAKKFIDAYILSRLDIILKDKLYIDPKSKFQETAQEKLGVTPSYKVLEESGPDHQKEFTVGVYLEKEMIAVGKGTSKQEAQISAAEAGIKAKKW
ncbi:MAG: ribonuclease III [bacterium]|nr:ribonuclease III [bacterium]